MKIRLCGSFIVPRKSDASCTHSLVTNYLFQLPKHCFTQLVYPVEDLSVIILVYTTDENFDLDLWYDEEFEM